MISHPLRTWADALERLLAPRWDIDVVTAQSTASWVRHAVVNEQADILLSYMSATDGGLPDQLADLFAHNPRLRVVIISDSQDASLMCEAIRAGVRGWVETSASFEHLVRVLRGVARGETWLPPALLSPVLDLLLDESPGDSEEAEALSELSVRELEVLGCLVRGLTRQEIADRLTLSPHTVRTHINNLLHKLGVHSTLAAVSIARQSGSPEWLHAASAL